MHPALDTLRRQAAAWSRGDLDGYLAHVHPDVVYIGGATMLRGRDALDDHYRGRDMPGPLRLDILDATLSADHASVVLAWALGDDGPRGRALVVLTKDAVSGAWLLRQDATLSG